MKKLLIILFVLIGFSVKSQDTTKMIRERTWKDYYTEPKDDKGPMPLSRRMARWQRQADTGNDSIRRKLVKSDSVFVNSKKYYLPKK